MKAILYDGSKGIHPKAHVSSATHDIDGNEWREVSIPKHDGRLKDTKELIIRYRRRHFHAYVIHAYIGRPCFRTSAL